MPGTKYGIVVDSGSSGSRIQIYRWESLSAGDSSASPEVLASLPLITQEEGWSYKTSPGVSTFADVPKRLWRSHYRQLFRFAEKVIPQEKHQSTPVYVLSTAGMRLLPENKRSALLAETCNSIRKNTNFALPSCEENVQTIDGSTEGLYGWLALNYLMGSFNRKNQAETLPKSVGFMDMGGASTQIAFVPSAEEIRKHDEDLSTVTLRTNDGKSQTWRVFVETWLGFGANQGRTRYLDNLISLSVASKPGSRSKRVLDPCMPSGAVLSNYKYHERKYTIEGTGNYESCLREIYPLLMKHLPCHDEPCLFNGIHGPKMDFELDKFVGVSEYWYTANDVFHSGGEYNFHNFNEKVKTYCESSWDHILSESKAGAYSNLPENFLLDACFKASWVINILHEGFGLPRLGVDLVDKGSSSESKEVEQVHVPFKSADSIDGKELSWTLGKIILEASSQITGRDGYDVAVIPSKLSQNMVGDAESDSDDEITEASHFSLFSLLVLLLLALAIHRFGKRVFQSTLGHLSNPSGPKFMPLIRNALNSARTKAPRFLSPQINRIVNYMDLQDHEENSINLEEGHMSSSPQPQSGPSFLRTRSTINVTEDLDTRRPVDFMNKPFTTPKLSSSFYNQLSESRESLSKVSTSGSSSRNTK